MKHITNDIHPIGSPKKNTGAVIPSVCLSTIFAMNVPLDEEGFQYGRIGNPTRMILEKTLAQLEKAEFCSVFSSGSSAIAIFLLTLRPGDTVLCHTVMYEGTQRLFQKVFNQLDIHCECVDIKNLKLVESNMKPNVKWIFFESPTNPMLEVLDIRSICRIAHNHNVMVAVDNTLASPAVQKPISFGADVVIESLTKAINGHSDVIGGLVATNNREIHKKISFLQQTIGAILSPFDCFLVLRGLRTLHIRVEAQQKSSQKVLDFLTSHKRIQRIHFPGLNSKSELFTVKKQMKGCGSVLSFHLKRSVNPFVFLKRLRLITIAQSFGGAETIIQQPTRMMNLSFTEDERTSLGIDDWFFRLSIGLEKPEEIINDLREALK